MDIYPDETKLEEWKEVAVSELETFAEEKRERASVTEVSSLIALLVQTTLTSTGILQLVCCERAWDGQMVRRAFRLPHELRLLTSVLNRLSSPVTAARSRSTLPASSNLAPRARMRELVNFSAEEDEARYSLASSDSKV